jgi:NADPH2:quinone reductase
VNTMRAIHITAPGGPEVLALTELARPEPKAGEVLIRVHAAGVNRPDVFQRMGSYPPPPGASPLPGLEVAGEIVGGDLLGSSLKLGDMVCALVPGGGYAEYCVTPTSHCLPIPAGLTALEAAALPETFFTVWTNVFDRVKLAPGETLLVQGGTSGIGVAAIQIAKALGHRVFATAGSDEKCRACEALGAERGINYRTEDFVQVIKALTENRGVDVILDMVGGDYLQRQIQSLAFDGRLVFIALLGGAKTQVDLGRVLQRRLTITASTLRPRDVQFKADIAQRLQQHVWPLLIEGKIKPVIDRVYDLQDADKAHAYMESGQHIGKIMLKVV